MTTPDTSGLKRHRIQRMEELQARTIEAIEQLYRMNEVVCFSSVAKKAEVSRNFLYQNKVLADRIRSYRGESIIRYEKKISVFSKVANKSSIKLRQISARYKTVLAENRALKKEIDTLRSYIETLSHSDNEK